MLSEVQAKMDPSLGSEEDRRNNAAKMGQAESLLLYTPWELGKGVIAKTLHRLHFFAKDTIQKLH